MSWRKGGGTTATTTAAAVDPVQATTSNLVSGMKSLGVDESVKEHETEKFLILNILQNLVEDGMMSEENLDICRHSVHSSNKFDAKSARACLKISNF